MKSAFIVTSAINTRFGVHSADTRLQQTLDTIASIKNKCSTAHITIIEMAGELLTPAQKDTLQQNSDVIIDFTGDANVKQIYTNPNWDIVKSATELMCFGHTLGMIADHPAYAGVDRFFKVSGRYLLNDDFDINKFYAIGTDDKYIFAKRKDSQFPPQLTGGVSKQFMSRCWSFPASEIKQVASMYKAMLMCMQTIVGDKGYIDIEHLLHLYTEPDRVYEMDVIGVQGLLGPNGVLVRD